MREPSIDRLEVPPTSVDIKGLGQEHIDTTLPIPTSSPAEAPGLDPS